MQGVRHDVDDGIVMKLILGSLATNQGVYFCRIFVTIINYRNSVKRLIDSWSEHGTKSVKNSCDAAL